MNTKTKRPPVMTLDSLMVNQEPALAAPPLVRPKEPAPKEAFRTSVYFHRSVHDKLRAIAFEERKTVMDLINEGLDHVLAKRNYPTTAELRAKA